MIHGQENISLLITVTNKFVSTIITAAFFLLILKQSSHATTVTVKSGKRPASHVVIMLTPIQEDNITKPKLPTDVAVTQKEKLFHPYVSVIPVGTTVNFPNKDTTRHHVYSFSDAKQFQIPLYLGNSQDIIFDKPGIVSLGCNIHDWMLGYIVVSNAYFSGVSNQVGQIHFSNLPAGEYKVEFWYPGIGQKGFAISETNLNSSVNEYKLSIPARAIKDRPPALDEEDQW